MSGLKVFEIRGFLLLQHLLFSGAASAGVATRRPSLRHCQTLALDQLTILCLHLIPERLKHTKLTHSLRAAWSNGNVVESMVWQRLGSLSCSGDYTAVEYSPECVADFYSMQNTSFLLSTLQCTCGCWDLTKRFEDVDDDFGLATINNLSVRGNVSNWHWNNRSPHVSALAECENPKS